MPLFYPEYRGSIRVLLSNVDKPLTGYTASYLTDICLKGRQIWETGVNDVKLEIKEWNPFEVRL
jgi:hypothetical protein